MGFHLVVVSIAVLAGAIASVAGFGIGSILTPLLSLHIPTKTAVAAVSIPHFLATAARFWTLRQHINRRILLNFGILSAAGGLAGALVHSYATSPQLTLLFAALLIFAGIMAVSGWSQRLRFGRRTAWIAGALSGVFGGAVGNQGGIRSAALLGFNLDRTALVGTATAIALIVDGARMPVYFVTDADGIRRVWITVAAASAGVLIGTFVGANFLRQIPERVFRPLLGVLLLALGATMAWRVFV